MKLNFRPSTLNLGLILVLTAMVVSGFANFLNKLAMTAFGGDAFGYTTIKNILAAVFLSLIIFLPVIWRRLRLLTKADWGKLILVGLIGGSVPFLLFFKGLNSTSAVSASLIHKTLFVWVAIMAWPILKEKIGAIQFLAIGILIVGNGVLGGFKFMAWGLAETLILAATLIWSIETIMVKKFLKRIDPAIMAWGRMFFGSVFLLGYLGLSNRLSGLADISFNAFGWLTAVSVLLFIYVYAWFGALKRLSAGTVTCLLVLASPLTTFLNAIFTGSRLDGAKIFGAALMVFGIWLFFIFKRRPAAGFLSLDNYGQQ